MKILSFGNSNAISSKGENTVTLKKDDIDLLIKLIGHDKRKILDTYRKKYATTEEKLREINKIKKTAKKHIESLKDELSKLNDMRNKIVKKIEDKLKSN